MVTELLGPSLEDIRAKQGGRLCIKDVLMIGMQALEAI
jgi:hypothetical protein